MSTTTEAPPPSPEGLEEEGEGFVARLLSAATRRVIAAFVTFAVSSGAMLALWVLVSIVLSGGSARGFVQELAIQAATVVPVASVLVPVAMLAVLWPGKAGNDDLLKSDIARVNPATGYLMMPGDDFGLDGGGHPYGVNLDN